MNEAEQLQKDIDALGLRYGLTRIKVESLHFKRDFQLREDGSFPLVSEKAIVTALGKTSVVPIGEDQEYKNYEDAEVAVRKHWAAYFKERRERRSEDERLKEARRQKRYRERRKESKVEFTKRRK